MTDDDLRALFARLDERTKHIEAELHNVVTKEEFGPVARVVYGLVGFLCLGVVGAVFKLILDTAP